ncbi:MAG: DUF1343 domain-containing protein [Gemmatimonadota bacterium]|nr:DUF1343 domain-containing protein [Gemmatimonadota bacterium]
MPRSLASLLRRPLFVLLLPAAGCTVIYHRIDDPEGLPEANVRPGISVLLSDSIALISGKRLAIITNRAGVDERGRRDIDLLKTDKRATSAQVHLVQIFSPEHGLGATEDHTDVGSTVDRATGLPVMSLYGAQTIPPPDSSLRSVDALLFDLQDVGSRTWTYDGLLVYSMRSAARMHRPFIVLDRPNPITGSFVEGPMLDSALSNSDDPAPGHSGLAWAMYPIPLRHGMTIGELARMYNDQLKIGADLHVIPARRWSRELWFDRTGLPFVPPSPNLQTFQAVMLYPGLVAFEATNVSVGRGSATPFQLIGAPWMDPARIVSILRDRPIRGVRFIPTDFTPAAPGDGKYPGQLIHGLKVEVTARAELQTSRLTAGLLAAIHQAYPGKLTIDSLRFDRLFGSPSARRAITAGADPDAVIDSTYAPAYAFRMKVARYLLY